MCKASGLGMGPVVPSHLPTFFRQRRHKWFPRDCRRRPQIGQRRPIAIQQKATTRKRWNINTCQQDDNLLLRFSLHCSSLLKCPDSFSFVCSFPFVLMSSIDHPFCVPASFLDFTCDYSAAIIISAHEQRHKNEPPQKKQQCHQVDIMITYLVFINTINIYNISILKSASKYFLYEQRQTVNLKNIYLTIISFQYEKIQFFKPDSSRISQRFAIVSC